MAEAQTEHAMRQSFKPRFVPRQRHREAKHANITIDGFPRWKMIVPRPVVQRASREDGHIEISGQAVRIFAGESLRATTDICSEPGHDNGE